MPELVMGNDDPNAAPSGGRNPSQWFNTANFLPPAPLTGGNLGLQTNYGPATRTLDFSIFKNFPFTERWQMQFRAESFNLANTPQFSLPDNNRQDANFGRITATAQAASSTFSSSCGCNSRKRPLLSRQSSQARRLAISFGYRAS